MHYEYPICVIKIVSSDAMHHSYIPILCFCLHQYKYNPSDSNYNYFQLVAFICISANYGCECAICFLS